MGSKYIERSMILRDMAEGLLCRCDFLNRTLNSPGGRMNVLENAEWEKVRRKIKSSFPDNVDLSKVQGGESFRHSATLIVDECSTAFEIFLDVIDFKDAALSLLRETPTSFQNLKLGHNSVIIRLFFDLFVAYVRVHLSWTSIEDRQMIMGVYTAAYSHVHGSRDQNVSRVVQLIHAFENPLQQVAEEMFDISDWVGEILFETYDSIFFSFQTEELFRRAVLNPIEDLDNLTNPAKGKLTPTTEKSMYTELMYVDKYKEWVFYASLVCPSILMKGDPNAFSSPQMLTKMILEQTLVENIFRGSNLVVHLEMDVIANWFPPRGWGLKPPKGFKIKNFLKDVAKVAAEQTGLVARERRAYLFSQLTQLKFLFETVPGLLGPKFPMLIAGMSMVRAEVFAFFRHSQIFHTRGTDYETKITTKAALKVLNEEDYEDPTIANLISLQYDLINIVSRNKPIIQQYYIEYLQGCHKNAIQHVMDANQGLLAQFGPGVLSIFEALIPGIDALDLANPVESSQHLQGWRLNWDRAVSSITQNRASLLITGDFKSLAVRMETATLHSRYVDDIDGILMEFCELHQLYFLNDELMRAFDNSLRLGSGTALSFVNITASCVNCVHPDCPQDHSNLSATASRQAEGMVNKMAEYTQNVIEPLWQEYERLARQVLPIEAGNRIERVQRAKQRGGQNAQITAESPAGTESMAFCRDQISMIIGYQRALANVLGSVNKISSVTVFDKRIIPSRVVTERVRRFLKEKMLQFIVQNNDMGRPSDVVGQIYSTAQAVHSALVFLNEDLTPMIRDILFHEFYDLTLPPPGHPLLPPTPDTPESTGAITMVCNWMENFVNQASQRQSGIVFLESKQTFLRTNPRVSLRAELYMEKGELINLCELIGIQGVRSVERRLICIIRDRFASIKQFIYDNDSTLSEFKARYFQGDWDGAAHQIRGASAFLNHLVHIGVALAVRSLLIESLALTLKRHAVFVRDLSELVVASMDKYVGLEASMYSSTLASDCGVSISDPDISLSSSLHGLCANAEDLRVIELLPYALPCCFPDPWWEDCRYITTLGVCESNEHLIPYALRKLISAFQLHRPTGMQNSETMSSTRSVEEFVDSASFVLLRMSMRARDAHYRALPVRTMIALLERFVHNSPLVQRSRLESIMPYSLLHSSHVDISLGRQRGGDSASISLSAFASEEDLETKEG